MKKLLLLMFTSILLFGKMHFAEPMPSFDEPRKWVIKLHSADLEVVNHTLGAIYNVLKIYPDEGIKIAVVSYAHGIRALRKDYDKHTLSRISSLMDYEVEFIVCRNTMETMKWKDEDFIEGVSYVQAGVADLIEKSADGWNEVTPY